MSSASLNKTLPFLLITSLPGLRSVQLTIERYLPTPIDTRFSRGEARFFVLGVLVWLASGTKKVASGRSAEWTQRACVKGEGGSGRLVEGQDCW